MNEKSSRLALIGPEEREDFLEDRFEKTIPLEFAILEAPNGEYPGDFIGMNAEHGESHRDRDFMPPG